MKRLLVLAWIAGCSLGGATLLAQDPAWSGKSVSFDSAPVIDSAEFCGPGVWGRVNPAFCGNPCISFAADLVFLGRAAPSNQTILLDGGFNPLLDASDLGSDSSAGGRFNFTFFNPNGWDFMFDGLFMGEMHSRQTVDPSGGVNLIFYQGFAADPVDSADYRSNLNTGEFNVRRRLNPNVALLAGVRHLQLNENLDFFQGSVSNGAYFSQAENRLWGGQLGVEGVLPARGYGRFFASAKYGIYNNRYEIAAQAMSGGSLIGLRVQDDMGSGVGDFNAGFEVQTVPRMTLRFGYQCLVLTDVATSVDQLNQYSIFTQTGAVAKSSPVYHGGFVGLVFVF